MAKVDIEVTQASASAIAAIEKNGGRIVAGALLGTVLQPFTWRAAHPVLPP